MANKEKRVNKWHQALSDLGLIKPEDKVEEYLAANWAEVSFGPFGSWRNGTLIFTTNKLVYMTSFGISQFSVDYSDIREVRKCFAGLLPMGMCIVAYDKQHDKMKKYKLWVGKRNKWMGLVSDKAGLAR